MVDLFGWRLPLAPTEKKLKLSMNIALDRYDGLLLFDHSFVALYENFVARHPTESKSDATPAEFGAKFVAIGEKIKDYLDITEMTAGGVTFPVKIRQEEPYLEIYCKPENATGVLTAISTQPKCHVGGLEVWNAHRCALARLTFPADFPETPAGSDFIKGELQRLHAKSKRTPKVTR